MSVHEDEGRTAADVRRRRRGCRRRRGASATGARRKAAPQLLLLQQLVVRVEVTRDEDGRKRRGAVVQETRQQGDVHPTPCATRADTRSSCSAVRDDDAVPS